MICENILKIRPKVLLILLSVFAVFNTLKWTADFISSPYHPLDFRTYYLAASTYFQDRNPYSDSQNSLNWIKQNKREVNWESHIGFPHATPVYAPQFVWFFGPYCLLEFNQSKIVQLTLNLFAIVCIIFCVSALSKSVSLLFTSLAVLAFRGSWYALDNGQPMLQVLAICIFATYLLKKKNMLILPGLLFGVVAFKFTLILPFAIFLFCEKQYKTLLTLMTVSILLNAAAIYFHPGEIQLLHQWKTNMENLWAYPHVHASVNGLSVISTSISVAVIYFIGLKLSVLKIAMLLLLLVSLSLSAFSSNRQKPYFPLFFAGLSSLCFGQHLIYDILVLIVFRILMADGQKNISITEILLISVLVIPLGSIAGFTGLDALNFAVPLLLVIYWCMMCSTYLPARYKLTKKAS